MTLHADDSDILDRISAALATEEPHLTGMYRVFSRLTVRDRIPDEDAVRRLPRRPAGAGGYGAWGGAGDPDLGAARRRRMAVARHLAKVTAMPALLLAILITIVAFTSGGGSRCTRAGLHGAPGVAGVSCTGGAAAPQRPGSSNR